MDVLQILTSFSGAPQLLQNQTGAPPKIVFLCRAGVFFSKKKIFFGPRLIFFKKRVHASFLLRFEHTNFDFLLFLKPTA
jgi:hypothetical protein